MKSAAKLQQDTAKTCQYLKEFYKKNAENVIFSAFFRDVANGKRTNKKDKRNSPLMLVVNTNGEEKGGITRLSYV